MKDLHDEGMCSMSNDPCPYCLADLRAENASLHAKLERVTKAALTLTQTAWEGDLDEMVVDFTAFEMLCAALDDKDGAG